MKKTIGYFLHGLLFAVPVLATVYIVFKTFNWVDTIIPIDQILPFRIPGLGMILVFGFVTLCGYLGSMYFFNPVMLFFERSIDRAPLIKIIYTSIKDLMSAFVGEKKRFNQPVLVTLNKDAQVQQIGFITRDDLTHFDIGADKVAVYLPMAYNFAGNLVIVPKENIIPLKASGTEMMKFVISGGVTES